MSHRSTIIAACACLLVLVASTIFWRATASGARAEIGADEDAAVGIRYHYGLLTHCGVDYIRFDGRWWEAQPHLDDGNGNPPPGWDNPAQEGTLTLISASALRFEATSDKELDFVEMSVAPTPQMCG